LFEKIDLLTLIAASGKVRTVPSGEFVAVPAVRIK
jgi:hypothetical protein